jgi:hypothetical protein
LHNTVRHGGKGFQTFPREKGLMLSEKRDGC